MMTSFYVSLFLAALLSSLQTPIMSAQTPAAACASGYHRASWKRCPMNDVPGEPSLPCEQVNVCLPNCPEGYGQASGSHSVSDTGGEPACVPAKPATLCSPVNFQLIYAWQVPVVWHWRVEISEKCATSRLKAQIQPAYDRVAALLQGDAVGQYRVVVGPNGQVIDSSLLSGGYISLPPKLDPNRPLSTTVFSELAAETLNRLRFRPYLIHGHPTEFQTTVTIPFKFRK
jgi:hypothetical protein